MNNQEEKIYYASYRGYVNLYLPFKAKDDIEANTIRDTLPETPTKGQDLVMISPDLDFELDYDYMPLESEITFSPVPNKLSKAIINTAVSQTTIREERRRQSQIESLTKQIEAANAQLLTATKGITDNIATLQEQLNTLTKPKGDI